MDQYTTFRSLVIEMWRSRELRRRILYTIGVLIVYRIGASLTLPGVHVNSGAATSASGGLINSLGILGGGGLRYFSLFALGVSPYITASIIIQLLSTNVVPFLTNLSKSGEKGRKTQDMITRCITIPLGILQSIGIIELLLSQKVVSFNSTAATFIFIIVLQVGGIFLALWFGDQINNHGLGNGVSMIILSGVVSSIPFNFFDIFKMFLGKAGSSVSSILIGLTESLFILGFYFILVFVTIFLSQSVRYIPVKNIGSGLTKKSNSSKSYVLLRINTAGVIPVIFATSLMSIPTTIVKYINNSELSSIINFIFNRKQPFALFVEFWLITGFTYFYSKITVNPERFAENLQKSGSFIPGIIPGYSTSKYINKILNHLNFYGSMFLGIIAIIPYILSIIFKLPPSFGIGGTGMLIFVMVIINLVSQIKARIIQLKYKNLKVMKNSEFGLW